jgi:hypothetical protein
VGVWVGEGRGVCSGDPGVGVGERECIGEMEGEVCAGFALARGERVKEEGEG